MLLCSTLTASGIGLKEDIEYLSSPLLGGRGTGTCGSVETSWYILRRFRAAGLENSVQTFTTPQGVGRNVIGIHKGNPRSDRYTLVMAHYDGLGTFEGNVYPGADSNASGVAVLLSLADSLAGSGKNFIFVGLDGYNCGRAGAEALATMPWKLDMVANIDIIGSTLAPPNKYRPDFIIVLGGEKYEKEFNKANEGPVLRPFYNYYKSTGFTDYFYTQASDQAPFLKKKIPAVMFTSGITMNTNKASDTFDTLDYPVLERRRDFILAWLRLR